MTDPVAPAAGFSLDAEGFVAVRDAITGFCGVRLSDDYHARLQRVVRTQMQELGLDDLKVYLVALRQTHRDDGALPRLVDNITNTETYFFREDFQLDALSDEILPLLVDRPDRRQRLSIWSAGCSSGEEPYTIAMLLRLSPLWRKVLHDWELRVLGTDINRRVLRKARAATYSASSFKALEKEQLRDVQQRFFEPDGDRFRVCAELREMVSFLHLNLLDRASAGLLMDMDVILCRNVLMYFPAPLRLQALQGYFRKLVVGGYLLLGHSENLLGMDSPFEPVRLKSCLVYRKPPRSQWRHWGADWGA